MVIRSILTQTEISFFAKVYGIGLVSNFETLEGGSENSNYVLETMKGKYILTISEDKGLDQLSNLVHLYDHLNENQFPTSIIMRGLDGKSITDYKGKLVILKNFIKGTIVKNPCPRILFQIGVLAAKLHKIPLTKGIQDKFPYGISHFNQAQSWDINNSFINWLKRKAEFLANNLRTDLPKGLVHGDIFGDNLIQCEGGVVALIDFEESSHSPFVFEIGMAIIGTCLEDSKVNFELVKALIKGYQSIRPLSDDEMEAIQIFCVYAGTAIAFWRFRQFNMIVSNSNLARRYEEMVDVVESILKTPPELFLETIFM